MYSTKDLGKKWRNILIALKLMRISTVHLAYEVSSISDQQLPFRSLPRVVFITWLDLPWYSMIGRILRLTPVTLALCIISLPLIVSGTCECVEILLP